jgi:hypothetical protein
VRSSGGVYGALRGAGGVQRRYSSNYFRLDVGFDLPASRAVAAAFLPAAAYAQWVDLTFAPR